MDWSPEGAPSDHRWISELLEQKRAACVAQASGATDEWLRATNEQIALATDEADESRSQCAR